MAASEARLFNNTNRSRKKQKVFLTKHLHHLLHKQVLGIQMKTFGSSRTLTPIVFMATSRNFQKSQNKFKIIKRWRIQSTRSIKDYFHIPSVFIIWTGSRFSRIPRNDNNFGMDVNADLWEHYAFFSIVMVFFTLTVITFSTCPLRTTHFGRVLNADKPTAPCSS